MQGNLHERLNTEITRKQFLQYMTGAVLMVFGLHNLLSLFTGNTKIIEHNILIPQTGPSTHDGFGARPFGR